MRIVTSIAQIDEARRMSAVGGGLILTNLFMPREDIQRRIDRCLLLSHECRGAVLLLCKENGFVRLYFVARDEENLEDALSRYQPDITCPTVADLIAKPVAATSLAKIFQTSGFSVRALLIRMVKRGPDRIAALKPGRNQIEMATLDDECWIAGALKEHFDPLVEQIPREEEIREAIARKNVLIARVHGALAGFLHFEKANLAATIRYWFVEPGRRGSGTGSALMHAFLGGCMDVKRILLWVLKDNEEAIQKYEHYGFTFEGLVDQVVVRQNHTI